MATPAANTSDTSRFLDFPAELRLMVYEQLFQDSVASEIISIVNYPATSSSGHVQQHPVWSGMAVLSTCRITRKEALPLLPLAWSTLHVGLFLTNPTTGEGYDGIIIGEIRKDQYIAAEVTKFNPKVQTTRNRIQYLDLGVQDLSAHIPVNLNYKETALATTGSPPLRCGSGWSAYDDRIKLAKRIKRFSGSLPNIKCITFHDTKHDQFVTRMSFIEFLASRFPQLKESRVMRPVGTRQQAVWEAKRYKVQNRHLYGWGGEDLGSLPVIPHYHQACSEMESGGWVPELRREATDLTW